MRLKMSVKNIVSFISTLLFILQFYYLLKIYSYSKVDYFEYKIKPGEKENFFIDLNKNEVINISNDINCISYQDLIMDKKTQKLGDVFTTNLTIIYSKLSNILVASIITIVFLVFFYLIILIIQLFPSSYQVCSKLILLISLVLIGSNIAILINCIQFIYYFYKGDINTYVDFLNCENVNYLGFKRYRNVELLKSHFKTYITIMVINFVVSCVKECIKEFSTNE